VNGAINSRRIICSPSVQKRISRVPHHDWPAPAWYERQHSPVVETAPSSVCDWGGLLHSSSYFTTCEHHPRPPTSRPCLSSLSLGYYVSNLVKLMSSVSRSFLRRRACHGPSTGTCPQCCFFHELWPMQGPTTPMWIKLTQEVRRMVEKHQEKHTNDIILTFCHCPCASTAFLTAKGFPEWRNSKY
jgi:hypothetical protein